jgi:multidrug resistance efflux pump
VKRGQVLAKVEPDVNQAQTLSEVRSGLTLAEIHARDAQKDLETNQRLFEEGLLSDQQLKDFRVKFDTASENLEVITDIRRAARHFAERTDLREAFAMLVAGCDEKRRRVRAAYCAKRDTSARAVK